MEKAFGGPPLAHPARILHTLLTLFTLKSFNMISESMHPKLTNARIFVGHTYARAATPLIKLCCAKVLASLFV